MEDDDSNVEMTEMTIAETNVNVDTETGLLVSDFPEPFLFEAERFNEIMGKKFIEEKI